MGTSIISIIIPDESPNSGQIFRSNSGRTLTHLTLTQFDNASGSPLHRQFDLLAEGVDQPEF